MAKNTTVSEAEGREHVDLLASSSTDVDPSLGEKATIPSGALEAMFTQANPALAAAERKIEVGVEEIVDHLPQARREAVAQARAAQVQPAPRRFFKKR